MILGSGATVAGGSSFQRLRRALCDDVGQIGWMTVAETDTSADRLRQVIVTDLQSDGQMADVYDGFWLYVVNGTQNGQVRRVLKGQYAGGFGGILVDRPFAVPLAQGTQIELCDCFPAVRTGTTRGALEALNEGLEPLPIIDVVTMPAVANQLDYPLSDYPWPIKQLSKVFWPRGTTDPLPRRREMSTALWRFVNNAEAPILTLRSSFATDNDFEVELYRPANTWICMDGVWGDSQTGLRAVETDACLYDVRTVVRSAKPVALRQMGHQYPLGSKERVDYLEQAREADEKAGLSRAYNSFKGSGVQKVGATGGRWSVWG